MMLVLDVVLFVVIWYEKFDLFSIDMYLYVYLFSLVIDLLWEICLDFDVFVVIVCVFSVLVKCYLGICIDVVLIVLQYDILDEMVYFDGIECDWLVIGEVLVLGRMMSKFIVVEWDYIVIYDKWLILGLFIDQFGMIIKGYIVYFFWEVSELVVNFGVMNFGVVVGCLVIIMVKWMVDVILVLFGICNG